MRELGTDPVALISQLRSTLDELKGAQRVGADNVLGYLNHSNNSYDYSLRLTDSQTKKFTLTFKHDHALHGSVQKLSEFYSLDNPNVTAGVYPAWANGPPVFYRVQKLPPTDTENRWLFHVVNSGASTWDVYFKFFFHGTDSGTFTIT